MQYEITEDLDNLDISTTKEKYVIYQLDRNTKHLEDTNNIITEQVITLTSTKVLPTANGDKKPGK